MKSLLEEIRGGNVSVGEGGLLGLIRDVPDTEGNNQILADLQKQGEEDDQRRREEALPSDNMEAFAVGFGERVHQMGMGARELFGENVDEERARGEELMKPVDEKYPIATGLGAFASDMSTGAPLGMGAGVAVSKIPGLVSLPAWAQRGATGLGMGSAEGSVSGLAQGDITTGSAVGGTLGAVTNVALPPAMRGIAKLGKIFLNKAIQKADGPAAAELQTALEKFGITMDDIKTLDLSDLPDNMTPDQAARAILFKKNEIPTTKSRITQTQEDFADEVRVSRQADDQGAQTVRERVSDESAAIQNRLKNLSAELGVSDKAGDTVKSALTHLDTDEREGIKKAYTLLSDNITETNAGSIPLNKSMVRDSIDDVLFGTKPVSDETRTAIQRASAKYGILGDNPTAKGAQTVVDFDGAKITFNGKQEELSLGNFEEFRKQLNQAFQKDSSGSVKSVKGSLDKTVLEATELLEEVSKTVPMHPGITSMKGLAESARNKVIGRAEKLNTGTLVPKLLNTNPRTGTPFVEATKVTDKIFSASTPTEELARLTKALSSSGEKGKAALKNLQSDVVMRLTSKAFKNAGKLERGQTPFNITAFTNEMRSIGDDKLALIFKGNEDALKAIKEVQEIGKLMKTPDSAVQKGSAPDIINAVIRASRLTAGLGGDVLGIAGAQVFGGQISAFKRRAVQKRIIEMTDLNKKEAITFMNQTYPELAAVLGLTAVGTEEITDNE